MDMPMDIPTKLKGDITVRVTLGFQDAPEVHTLLAMTPVRARGKLVVHALENFIKQTGHPAGDVSTQLAMVAQWLDARSNGVAIPYVPQTENHKIPAVKRGKESDKQNLDDKKEISSTVSIGIFSSISEHIVYLIFNSFSFSIKGSK